MREDQILNQTTHGARYILIPGDMPPWGNAGTIEHARAMAQWIAADPARQARHRSRPMKIPLDATVKDVVKKLARILDHEGLIDEYFSLSSSLDYARPGDPLHPNSEYCTSNARWIAVYPVTGTTEGVYIHVDLIGPDPENDRRTLRHQIVTAKTWDWENAWKITRRTAELLGV